MNLGALEIDISMLAVALFAFIYAVVGYLVVKGVNLTKEYLINKENQKSK